MSTDIYFYSYPKDAVKKKVHEKWETGSWVNHYDDVHGEVKNNTSKLIWVAQCGICFESLNLISPKQNGHYHGEMEFAVTKEIVLQFADFIRDVDYVDQELPEHVAENIIKLKQIAETFDFEHNFLCVHTD